MSVTIDLHPEELAEIRRRTCAASDEEALSQAAREYLRVLRLRELKDAPGKFDFNDVSAEAGDLEPGEPAV
jgi:hypothetical protein